MFSVNCILSFFLCRHFFFPVALWATWNHSLHVLTLLFPNLDTEVYSCFLIGAIFGFTLATLCHGFQQPPLPFPLCFLASVPGKVSDFQRSEDKTVSLGCRRLYGEGLPAPWCSSAKHIYHLAWVSLIPGGNRGQLRDDEKGFRHTAYINLKMNIKAYDIC